jgi:hypothetical protein
VTSLTCLWIPVANMPGPNLDELVETLTRVIFVGIARAS